MNTRYFPPGFARSKGSRRLATVSLPMAATSRDPVITSIGFALFLFIRRLIHGSEAEGVFTLFAILFAVVGLLFMGLGLMGEYVARIYSEVRRRPRYLVRQKLGGPVAGPVAVPVDRDLQERAAGR